MTELIQAAITHSSPFSAEQVFDCWVLPQAIRQWMSSALQAMGLPGEILITQVDAKVGGSFCFSDRRPMGEAMHWGRYRQFTRPDVLAFSWNAGLQRTNTDDPLSLVTITLTNNTRGCDVSLTHSMDAQWRDYLQRTENGWRNMLVHIDAYLTGLQTTVR